ncbi:MAG TPA: Mur ligase domain-containing protein, partial [Mycoplana sp.]|nr:Mur ligase domain-containing protein [Mycoplana sp.]
MKIKDLAGTEIPDLGATSEAEIGGISADSRKVKPGDLFVALHGSKADGTAYV